MVCKYECFIAKRGARFSFAYSARALLIALPLCGAMHAHAQTCAATPPRPAYFYSSGLNISLPAYPRSSESSLLLLQNVIDLLMANPGNCRNIQQQDPYQSQSFVEGATAAGGTMECTTDGYTWRVHNWGVDLTATSWCSGGYKLSALDHKCYPVNATVCPALETQAGEPPACSEGGYFSG